VVNTPRGDPQLITVEYPVVAHFTDCSFNNGSTTAAGGVFSVTNGALMTFRGSSFESNFASNTGGVGYVAGGVVMMVRSGTLNPNPKP